MSTLPLIDFYPFYNGIEADRAELATKIKNTSIPTNKIAECFEWGTKFFALPLEERTAIPDERHANPQRGWSCVGSENTSKLDMVDNDDLEDEKEHFDHSSATDTEFPSKWLAEASIPGHRQFMEEYLEMCRSVGFEVLENLEQGLGLPKGELVNKCGASPIIDELRMNDYAPISTKKLQTGKFRRAWPQPNFGIITLLFQDDADGLEIQD